MSRPRTSSLERFRRAGVLGKLDLHFARTLTRLAGADGGAQDIETDIEMDIETDIDTNIDTNIVTDLSTNLETAVAFASRAPMHGHVFADLSDLPRMARGAIDEAPAGTGNALQPTDLVWPEAATLVEAVADSPLARSPESREHTPLVLDGTRLYLERYWRDQQILVDSIGARLGHGAAPDPQQLATMRQSLARIFPNGEGKKASDRQAWAAAVAALRHFCVVTGGPGTGKTSTVVRLLAILLETADEPLRVKLMAPTGKAAARLSQSVAEQLIKLGGDLRDQIPTEASTIHRALGVVPGKSGRFRHDADNPLAVDVVIVDEASMVALSLMTRLFEAVPLSARLILIGDRDQLASVEAGAVLGDLCLAGLQHGGFSPEFAAQLGTVVELPGDVIADAAGSGVWDAVVKLTESYRFKTDAGIGRLADAINLGRADDAVRCLSEESQLDQIAADNEVGLEDALRRLAVEGYRAALEAEDPADSLRALEKFRVLCAHRRGVRGVETLNQQIRRWLAEEGLVHPTDEWYDGRPLLVTQNDYQIDLFNGDIGIVRSADGGKLRAHFPRAGSGSPRSFAPARLPAHETVFAMTIHKSQGSEFTRVVVVLPDQPSPILTRELLYTGITRAREHVTVVGSEQRIREAISERVQRASGLQEALRR